MDPRWLWQLDDTEHWHVVTQQTLRHCAPWRSQHFTTGHGLLLALEHCAVTELPSVLLMDFYIGNDRGDAVTATVRQHLDERNAPAITIVGFSSVSSGSRAIVAAGGDCIVPKHGSLDGGNPDLARFLREFNAD